MIEIWKPFRDYPYEVSSHGRVRRSIPENNTWVGRVLKPHTDQDGYKIVALSKQGKVKYCKVHALVCECFHGPCPPNKNQVRHLDGDPANNFYGNVRWATALINTRDRKFHGTHPAGEKSKKAKLTQVQIDEIRKFFEDALNKRIKLGFQRLERGFKNKHLSQFAAKHGMTYNGLSCAITRGYGKK